MIRTNLIYIYITKSTEKVIKEKHISTIYTKRNVFITLDLKLKLHNNVYVILYVYIQLLYILLRPRLMVMQMVFLFMDYHETIDYIMFFLFIKVNPNFPMN